MLKRRGTVQSGAIFSNDERYRYSLWRVWNNKLPKVMFLGLNPSTADEIKNDPTVRRCIGFARAWGYGGLIMGNIFAFRATLPQELKKAIDPVGIDTDKWLVKESKRADIVVAGWGNHGSFLKRGEKVKKLIPKLYFLGLNKSGEPKHPLYLKKNLRPVGFG